MECERFHPNPFILSMLFVNSQKNIALVSLIFILLNDIIVLLLALDQPIHFLLEGYIYDIFNILVQSMICLAYFSSSLFCRQRKARGVWFINCLSAICHVHQYFCEFHMIIFNKYTQIIWFNYFLCSQDKLQKYLKCLLCYNYAHNT